MGANLMQRALFAAEPRSGMIYVQVAAQRHAASHPEWVAPGTAGRRGVARVLDGAELVVDPVDESVASHLLAVGYWEWWISRAIAAVTPPGARCVDVGANAGYFAALFQLLDAERVLAIEPHPELAENLRTSVRRNGWTNVEVAEVAVAEARRRVSLHVPDAQHLGGSTIMVDPARAHYDDILALPLDDLLRSWDRVDVIKLDCEGAEPLIWEGMQETLARNPKVHVFAEMFCDGRAEAWLDRIEGQGFRPHYVAKTGDVLPFRRELLAEDTLYVLHLHRES